MFSLGLLLPERSRFNRTFQYASYLFKTIRNGLLQEELPTATFTIINSMFMTLCQPIRNHSAKVLAQLLQLGTMQLRKTGFMDSRVILRSLIC